MNIGVFDSGIGGLTILRAFVQDLPHYTYIYYGDNANAPYGEKTPEEIYALTIKGIEFLFAKNCSLVVLACNTASTVLPRIQQEWLPHHHPGKKVLGVIRPTAEHMIQSGETEITLMATPATVSAQSYEKELKKLGSTMNIHSIPCPGLAKEIELSGGKSSEKIRSLLDGYCEGMRDSEADTPVYLCCTHYEYLEHEIKTITKRNVLAQSTICSKSFSAYLQRHSEIKLARGTSPQLFFTSSVDHDFEELSKK